MLAHDPPTCSLRGERGASSRSCRADRGVVAADLTVRKARKLHKVKLGVTVRHAARFENVAGHAQHRLVGAPGTRQREVAGVARDLAVPCPPGARDRITSSRGQPTHVQRHARLTVIVPILPARRGPGGLLRGQRTTHVRVIRHRPAHHGRAIDPRRRCSRCCSIWRCPSAHRAGSPRGSSAKKRGSRPPQTPRRPAGFGRRT